MEPQKFQVKNRLWWNKHPMTYDWHGTMAATEGTREFFEEIDRRFVEAAFFAHDKGTAPFSHLIAYERLQGKLMIEVGCGAGTLAAKFAQYGAKVYAVDLADRSVALTKARFRLYHLPGTIIQCDAENLPFPDGVVDYVWSWGVLHHTQDTDQAISEIYRVLKPGGTTQVMLYHKGSFRYWVHLLLLRGVLAGNLLRMSIQELVTRHTDGAVARHFTKREALTLFSNFRNVRMRLFGLKSELVPLPTSVLKTALVQAIPDGLARWLLSKVGWFLFIEAKK